MAETQIPAIKKNNKSRNIFVTQEDLRLIGIQVDVPVSGKRSKHLLP